MSTLGRWRWWWAAAGALALSCSVERPSDFAPQCPSYAKDIDPVLVSRCSSCHGEHGEGGFQVTSYRQTLSTSEADVPRVVAGDAASRLLQAVRGEFGGHTALADDEQRLLTRWVVDCRAAPDRTQIHPLGWASPVDPEHFHGAALRAAKYLTFDCQQCHGADLRGGKSKVDCNSCHAKGPFACNTCHGDQTSAAPPRALDGSKQRTALGVGAHRQHVLDGPLHKAMACTACHPAISNAEDEGHYRFEGAFVTDRPPVVLTAATGQSATWSRETATCTNSACHAPNPSDAAATTPVATWTSLTGENAKCGSCHGLGPTGHVSTRCEGCHTSGYADGGVDLAVHVNGVVDFGPATDCGLCHGAPGRADFRDTHGNPDAGAHEAHLKLGSLRGPLGCQDCHVVPARATDKGHADSPLPAEVFPAEWDGGLAAADTVTPSYDAATQRCTTYCHGAGAKLVSDDLTPGLERAPRWTAGAGEAACGRCHGLPPTDGKLAHTIATSVQTCAMCHGLSVKPDGTIRFFVGADGGVTTHHMDGVLNGNN